MKNITLFLIAVFVSASISHSVFAQQAAKPDAIRTINYQGLLLDEAKHPLTGHHQITIRFYDAPKEGNLLHSENFSPDIENGIFSVVIGSEQALDPTLGFDKQYWIGVSVDDAGELSPRTALTSVPYAIRSNTANALAKGASGAVTQLNGKSGNITIKGGTGTSVQSDGNTITITSLPPGSLGNEQIQVTNVNSVTGTANQITANPTTGNVILSLPQNIHTSASPTFAGMKLSNFTNAGIIHNNSSGDLSSSLITNSDISSGANIASSKLNLTNAITSGDIVNGAIANADINGNANIAYTKLNLLGSISNADVAAGANISSSKLNLANAITSGDIVNGTIVNADVNANANIAYTKLNLLGSISNSDVAASANISDAKLAVISSSGKVSNSATTATSANNADKIVLRDGSGNFHAGTITATLNGNAANISGVLEEDHGGTGITAYTKGDMLYASSANTLSKLRVGALGQVITVSGGVPKWAALSGVGVTSASGTVNQILVNGDSIAHTGGITLSLPQNIDTSASPSFAGLSLAGKASSASTTASDSAATLVTKDYVEMIANAYWNVGGNSGLNSSTNYFGTNDATDLVLKTNSTEAMRISSGGSLLLNAATGTTPVSGSGTRMMWIPSLGAFRAGGVDGAQWDNASIGTNSVAMGFSSTADGNYAVSLGYFTSADGIAAVALGTGTSAFVDGSVAMGSASQATGINSVAIGENATANGIASVAMGSNTTAGGLYSTAIGSKTTAGGDYSVVTGRDIKIGASSFGYNSGSNSSITMDISAMTGVAYFGDADLLIGNDDNAARSLKFYGSNNSATLNGAHFTAFKAQTQSADITYLLPSSQGTANSLLLNNGSGSLSWSTLSNLAIPTGAGVANTIAVWSASSVLGAASNLYYSSSKLGIGVSSPSQALDVSGNANISGIMTSGGIAMSGGSAVLSYSTISAGATITIPNNAVVKITDDAANAANKVTMPAGTNGQIIYIYNNDAQTTSGDIILANGAVGVYVYIDAWKKAN